MNISVGQYNFTAILFDNPAANQFSKMLPLTLHMIELNGNEKYADLQLNLVSDEVSPGTIEAGDIMLYGSDTLVLFYKSFRTTYRYTLIGRIEKISTLQQAVGNKNVTVVFRDK